MTGRNEPCPCGSGRKYKRCHWEEDRGSVAVVEPVARIIGLSDQGELYRRLTGEVMPVVGSDSPIFHPLGVDGCRFADPSRGCISVFPLEFSVSPDPVFPVSGTGPGLVVWCSDHGDALVDWVMEEFGDLVVPVVASDVVEFESLVSAPMFAVVKVRYPR